MTRSPDTFRRPLRWCGRLAIWLGFSLAFLGIAAAPLGLHCSFIERLTHLRLYWIGWLAVLLVWWIARKALLPALAALVLLAAALPVVFLYYRSTASAPAADSPNFTIASWNVHSSNLEEERAIAWLEQTDADLLLLSEINPRWEKRLLQVSARWPYQIREARAGASGIWLLSRWPLSPAAPVGLAAEQSNPWIACTASTPHGPVRLMGMHPRTPRGGFRFHSRNAQLDWAATFAASAPGPVVIFGDLNCTPFSPWFDRLLERGRLHDTARGRGLTPTWSSGPWWLPIDHILTGGNLQLQTRQILPDRLGSDHFPIRAVLGLSNYPP
jgi:endonuclease/exonuclease/phosphatase (EEP) superfamily protein YafD